MSTMQALLLSSPSGPSALALGKATIPDPIPGFVRLRVEAVGLNPVDAGLTGGGHPDWSWPHIGGLDAAGVVDEVGEGVDGSLIGRRVAVHSDLRRDGAFAQFMLADARALARIPDDLTAVTAAALPCAGMTAYQCVVRRLHVAPGQTVLVTGGNGGVGGFAIQLAKAAGARVIATASSRFDRLGELGADATVDYRADNAFDEIRGLAGDAGIDAIIDTVSPENASREVALLNHTGGIACVAGRATFDAVPPFGISPSIHEISLGAAYAAGRPAHVADLSTMLTDLLARVDAGALNPQLSRVIELAHVPDALAEIERRHIAGKIVAVVDQV